MSDFFIKPLLKSRGFYVIAFDTATKNPVNNKKREYQQRYRGRNRDKLKQCEAEKRRRLQNAEIITELSTSSNIEFTELVHEPIIDEISANSQNVAGLENIQHLFVEVSQQNERGQSSANGTEITNNYNAIPLTNIPKNNRKVKSTTNLKWVNNAAKNYETMRSAEIYAIEKIKQDLLIFRGTHKPIPLSTCNSMHRYADDKTSNTSPINLITETTNNSFKPEYVNETNYNYYCSVNKAKVSSYFEMTKTQRAVSPVKLISATTVSESITLINPLSYLPHDNEMDTLPYKPTGKFGPQVGASLFRPDNVYVEVSKTGKLTSDYFEIWLKNVFFPNVESKILLLIDS
ncbi:hypothetical protein PV328_010378 [Microctonus aethiopoides]|uniref:Uncharacterized protein n=1 Tax=Microctonus aethiopoides TaxID=144406 RepID=A0AA39KQE6_9HYME|nr:hypothetical protein PV328_010378 [Microctonus aethiopoides]